MRLRRRRVARVETDLDPFVDGRVWRLTRGRHFNGNPQAFRADIRAHAEQRGLIVKVAGDKLEPETYVWVQYGRAPLIAGQRCECGSTEVPRVHPEWARCAHCGRLYGWVEEEAEGETSAGVEEKTGSASPEAGSPAPPRRPSRSKGRLDQLTGVRLYRHEITDTVERCYGVAVDEQGCDVILSVDFPLVNGARVPSADQPGVWQYKCGAMQTIRFGGLIDAQALVADGPPVSWRIADDPGPEGTSAAA